MHDDWHCARKVTIGPRPLGVLCGIYQFPIRGALLEEADSTVLGSTWDLSLVERLFSLRLVRLEEEEGDPGRGGLQGTRPRAGQLGGPASRGLSVCSGSRPSPQTTPTSSM